MTFVLVGSCMKLTQDEMECHLHTYSVMSYCRSPDGGFLLGSKTHVTWFLFCLIIKWSGLIVFSHLDMLPLVSETQLL